MMCPPPAVGGVGFGFGFGFRKPVVETGRLRKPSSSGCPPSPNAGIPATYRIAKCRNAHITLQNTAMHISQCKNTALHYISTSLHLYISTSSISSTPGGSSTPRTTAGGGSRAREGSGGRPRPTNRGLPSWDLPSPDGPGLHVR